jgi:replicative DNA helicase
VIYSAIRHLAQKNEAADLITLTAELTRMGELDAAGGELYIIQICDVSFSTANLEHYAKIIADKAANRTVIFECERLKQIALEASETADEIKETFASSALSLQTNASKGQKARIYESVDVATELIEHWEKDNNGGILFGLKPLDDLVTGLYPNEMCMLAGESGGGKTAIMCQWLLNAARAKKQCLAASGEMSRVQLMQRVAFHIAGINGSDVRKAGGMKHMPGWIKDKALEAVEELSQLSIFFVDSYGETLSASRIETAAKTLKLKDGLDFIAVDYLQKIVPPKPLYGGKYDGRYLEIEALSSHFANLAIRLQCAVLCLSQYNMQGTLKGSQSLYADPFTILELSIEKEANYAVPGSEIALLNVDCSKQRDGRTGNVTIGFDKRYGRFVEVSHKF